MTELDDLLRPGAKSAKFENVGDTITGLIVDIDVRQATEYGTGKPLTFESGDPKEQIVVIVKAEGITPEDADDDLHRAVYVKGWGIQKRAFINAVKAARKPELGDRFTATLVGMKPSDRGGFPAKVYEYRIQALDAPAYVPDADVSDARAQARKLLDMGNFTNAQVAAATALPLDEIEAMGNVPF